MPLGVSRDHLELTSSLHAWAVGLDGPSAVREAESDAAASFAKTWQAVVEMGLTSIGIDERHGGGGGELLDQMIALESAARALLPGPLLGSTLVGQVATDADVLESIAAGVGAAVALTDDLALDVVDARWLLAPSGNSSWTLVDSDGWSAEPMLGPDLSRRGGRFDVTESPDVTRLEVDGHAVRRVLVALAAAEASGLAQWCVDTAVSYAKVREQFGKPIGSFQAIKHLCAEMLETTESIAAAAWDLGTALELVERAPDDADFATDVAATIAFDGAVSVAQACIQVLGGIGFTFEHDAHLYLRRAVALRATVAALTSGAEQSAARLARRASEGQRRSFAIDFGGADAEVRETTRGALADIAALPAEEQRAALSKAGFLMPQLPRPHGLDAGPVEQLVIDEELTRAGLARPDIAIGGWAVPTIVLHGTDEQRDRFVLPTLLGDIFWCQLFSEPGAGSDLAALSTKAVRDEGGWRLTGQKVWTSRAHDAEWAICLARTDKDAPPHKGITYFLVDMASEGIDVRPLREMTGEAMFNEVFLDDVFVPDDCVVGEVNDGWKLARTTLANERVAMGSKLGAATERAIELVADRADIEAARVGQQVALGTVCRLLGVRSTLRSIGGQGPGPESSVAKLLGVRNRQEASDLVADLLGPDALFSSDPTIKADVHEMLLARCLSSAARRTQILRNVAAERILGLPRS
jgi:alkylation response protein AidB-like acyl-CoA dehydrogenase